MTVEEKLLSKVHNFVIAPTMFVILDIVNSFEAAIHEKICPLSVEISDGNGENSEFTIEYQLN